MRFLKPPERHPYREHYFRGTLLAEKYGKTAYGRGADIKN
jgi:hypothetical protein